MKRPVLLIAFSGGRSSAFMTRFIMQHPKYRDYQKIVVFANTGKEREETLDFVQRCNTEWHLGVVWLEAVVHPKKGKGTTFKQVNYVTANRNGTPYREVIQKYGLPDINRPHCTRELKLVPIKKYMQSLGFTSWTTAVGIRFDEQHCINRKQAEKENKIYPLADDIRCTRAFVRSWWAHQPFDLELKDYEGNCDMCFKKSERKLLTLIREQPDLIGWWQEVERTYGQGRYTLFRGCQSAGDLIRKARQGDFIPARDETIDPNDFDPLLDKEIPCLCGAS